VIGCGATGCSSGASAASEVDVSCHSAILASGSSPRRCLVRRCGTRPRPPPWHSGRPGLRPCTALTRAGTKHRPPTTPWRAHFHLCALLPGPRRAVGGGQREAQQSTGDSQQSHGGAEPGRRANDNAVIPMPSRPRARRRTRTGWLSTPPIGPSPGPVLTRHTTGEQADAADLTTDTDAWNPAATASVPATASIAFIAAVRR